MLRYFNAAGADLDGEPGERHIPETHLVPNVIRAVLDQSEPLALYGDAYATADGTCEWDYVHVLNLANAHLLAVEYLQRHPGVHKYNLGTGRAYSVRQVIQQVEQQLGTSVPIETRTRRGGDPADSTLAVAAP